MLYHKDLEHWFRQHRKRLYRFYVYKRMFTPYEIDKAFIDETCYESDCAMLGILEEVIELKDDYLFGIRQVFVDCSVSDTVEYYKLSELRIEWREKDEEDYIETEDVENEEDMEEEK